MRSWPVCHARGGSLADSNHNKDIQLNDLYRDTVLDHFRSPRGTKPIDRVDIRREGNNPLCGDKLEMSIKMSDDTIEDVEVHCKGCAISVASTSMLAELVPGMKKDDALKLAEGFKKMMHGQPAPEGLDIGDLDSLEGVKDFPVRVKCALLAWMTIIDALRADAKDEDQTGAMTSTEDKQD